jgi:hypothetical protein
MVFRPRSPPTTALLWRSLRQSATITLVSMLQLLRQTGAVLDPAGTNETASGFRCRTAPSVAPNCFTRAVQTTSPGQQDSRGSVVGRRFTINRKCREGGVLSGRAARGSTYRKATCGASFSGQQTRTRLSTRAAFTQPSPNREGKSPGFCTSGAPRPHEACLRSPSARSQFAPFQRHLRGMELLSER